MSSTNFEKLRSKPKSIEAYEIERQDNAAVLFKAKEHRGEIVGSYCTYYPRGLVIAPGAIFVGLCGTYDKPIADAEKELPRNLSIGN